MSIFILSSCKEAKTDDVNFTEESITNAEIVSEDEQPLPQNKSIYEDDSECEKDYTEDDLVIFNRENAFNYCINPGCIIDTNDNQVVFSFEFNNGIPICDDENIYLFKVRTYENEDLTDAKNIVAQTTRAKKVVLSAVYETEYLFSRFIPAIKYEGEYVALSDGKFISNPEDLAINNEDYPEIGSKKGLLLDANTIDTELLYDLNVKRVVYNLPVSLIMGETENETYPTVDFEYDGTVYHFNGYRLAGFDSLFSYLTDNGFYSTAIILNDWNEQFPEMIHPLSRKKTWRSMYYAFNTEEEDGTKLLEATAMFLAQRYSGGDCGMVYDWVIANEINQQAVWNYMATDDLEYYAESFEKSFRTFYNAIKSNYKNANVYFSIDQDWNNNYGNNKRYFNGRDLLYSFNEKAKKGGNYNWGLSIHPYPTPLNNTRFWNGINDKTEEAKVVTPMNLSVVTDFMQDDDFLDTNGGVRDIAITELGFCSKAGEKIQAAAFAYCYYIIENNEYINSFLLNRQTDDRESLKSGLALGIYNKDYSEKYIAEVFKNVDAKKGESYIDEMLEIIGEDSLEEALNKAK